MTTAGAGKGKPLALRGILAGLVLGLLPILGCAALPGAAAAQATASTGARSAQAVHPRVDFTVPCQDCHRTRTPRVVKDWEASAHNPPVSCSLCHGDGEVEFTTRPSAQLCLSCHDGMHESKRMQADCLGCHRAHRLTTRKK